MEPGGGLAQGDGEGGVGPSPTLSANSNYQNIKHLVFELAKCVRNFVRVAGLFWASSATAGLKQDSANAIPADSEIGSAVPS
jgi:hypothetical protein